MPATTITIYDRPNVQTDKCLGYSIVRKCKASKLNMDIDDTSLPVDNTKNMFQQFVDLDYNYKGDTYFDAKRLENYNSFRVRASGTIPINSTPFNIHFYLYDSNGNPLGSVPNNYGNGHVTLNNDHTADWYLDVEITFYLSNGYNFIVNGNYKHSNDSHPRKLDVSLVPIMGGIYQITDGNLFFDFKLVDTFGCQIKDFSVDFVE